MSIWLLAETTVLGLSLLLFRVGILQYMWSHRFPLPALLTWVESRSGLALES